MNEKIAASDVVVGSSILLSSGKSDCVMLVTCVGYYAEDSEQVVINGKCSLTNKDCLHVLPKTFITTTQTK